jgi:four helix bundle protein
MLIETFRDLDAWKTAHELVPVVYRLTRKFPKDEMFGVTSQVRRSATSIPANIAEGFGRQGPKDFLGFIRIANGSLQETKYFLFLAKDLGYLIPEEYSSSTELSDRAGALLGGLQRSLKNQLEKMGGS